MCHSQFDGCLVIPSFLLTTYRVSEQGDRHLKQFTGTIDWDSPQLVGKMFELFLGDSGELRELLEEGGATISMCGCSCACIIK